MTIPLVGDSLFQWWFNGSVASEAIRNACIALFIATALLTVSLAVEVPIVARFRGAPQLEGGYTGMCSRKLCCLCMLAGADTVVSDVMRHNMTVEPTLCERGSLLRYYIAVCVKNRPAAHNIVLHGVSRL